MDSWTVRSPKFRDSDDFTESEVFKYGGEIFSLGKVLRLRSAAEMALDNEAKATEDLVLVAKLLTKTAAESMLYMEMIRAGLANSIGGAIRNGTQAQAWNDEQLAELENALRPVDLVQGMANAFRTERGIYNQFMEEIRNGSRMTPKESIPEPFKDGLFAMPAFQAYLAVNGANELALLNRETQSLIDLLEQSHTGALDEAGLHAIISPDRWGRNQRWRGKRSQSELIFS